MKNIKRIPFPGSCTWLLFTYQELNFITYSHVAVRPDNAVIIVVLGCICPVTNSFIFITPKEREHQYWGQLSASTITTYERLWAQTLQLTSVPLNPLYKVKMAILSRMSQQQN